MLRNSEGVEVVRGIAGGRGGDTGLRPDQLFYCGRLMHQCRCGRCDGRCGPTSGCPCPSCLLLVGIQRPSMPMQQAATPLAPTMTGPHRPRNFVLSQMVTPSVPTPIAWKQIPGISLKQVSFDGITLAGVNAQDEIFIAKSNLTTSPTWRKVGGKLKHVVVHGGALYGVNASDDIYFGHNTDTPNWKLLPPGKLKQISFDGTQLYGCNSADEIWCADSGLQTSPNWRRVEGRLKHVVVRAGKLYGVNANDEIYVGNSRGASPGWKLLPGGLKQVAYDGTQLVGVNSFGQLLRANSNIQTAPIWQTLDCNMSMNYIEVFGNQMYGLTAMNTLYYKTIP